MDFSFLKTRAIIEVKDNVVRLKPLDYYERDMDRCRRELSHYCLSYINDLNWNNITPHSVDIILDGWVIYKENSNDIDVGSDTWSLQWLNDRFDVTDICSRALYSQ